MIGPGVFERIASGYEPDLYPGKLTFIWAHDEIFRRVGWRKVTAVKEVTEYSIPGDHTTSRTEHLHAFAERLRMCLEEAQKVTVSK